MSPRSTHLCFPSRDIPVLDQPRTSPPRTKRVIFAHSFFLFLLLLCFLLGAGAGTGTGTGTRIGQAGFVDRIEKRDRSARIVFPAPCAAHAQFGTDDGRIRREW